MSLNKKQYSIALMFTVALYAADQPASYFLALKQRGHYTIFDVTGLPTSATPAEISQVVKNLSRKWHPDRNTDERAGEVFNIVRTAQDSYKPKPQQTHMQNPQQPYGAHQENDMNDFTLLEAGPWEIASRAEFKLSNDDKKALNNLTQAIEQYRTAQAYNNAFRLMAHRIEKPVSFTGILKGVSTADRRTYLKNSLVYILQRIAGSPVAHNLKQTMVTGINNLIRELQ